jgi:hypothetical protein
MPNLLGKIASWLGRRAQPATFAAGPFDGQSEEQIKATLAAALRGAHDEGRASEKARVTSILTAPNAAHHFLDLAVDRALGDATAAQAAAVLSRAETDAATRATLLKSSPLESANAPTIH